MNGSHQQSQDMFFDQSANRSPGAQRIPQQNLHRQPSRHFDVYGQMPNHQIPSLQMQNPQLQASPMSNSLYGQDDSHARYDTSRFDNRMNSTLGGAGYGYELPGAHTWNANAFGGGQGFNTFGTTGRMKSTPRGRTGLPNTWLDQQAPPMPPMGLFGASPQGPLGAPSHRPDNFMSDPDDELIPTAIVIKNIPFAVKKEALVELMTQLSLPLPYAFNYHFDNGVFRGLAFANFTSADETAAVINNLNHFDLQGRKLRVEYKKMLPLQERERIEREKRERRGQLEEQHRPMATPALHSQPSMSSLSSQIAHPNIPMASSSPIDLGMNDLDVNLNEPQTLEFYTQLLIFKREKDKETLIFDANLTPPERRIVHTLAHVMGLSHTSRGTGSQRQVHINRPQPGSSISPPLTQASTLHGDSSRRVLNRAATTDFSEARASDATNFGTLRGQHSTGFLGIPDSPNGFGAQQNLRAAKSFHDLRSYTPSPVQPTSFPPILQSIQANAARFQENQASMSGGTPTLTPTASEHALQQYRDESMLANGMGSMSFGNSLNANGGSPRRLRGLFAWDQESQGQPTGPIGSNRGFTNMNNNYDDQSRERTNGQSLPTRQPRGPVGERTSGFSRGRQNGHQAQGSDELRHQSSNADIIPE